MPDYQLVGTLSVLKYAEILLISEKCFSYRVETANASTKFIIRDSTSWGVHKEMVC